jgi:hypothetical protein
MESVGWDHPHVGRVEEVVCTIHGRAVTEALRTLGIGCIGTECRDPEAACYRCEEHVSPRTWIRRKFGGGR